MESRSNNNLDTFFSDKRFCKTLSPGKNKYPVIWKKVNCLVGECKGENIKHWFSFPFSAPAGLVVECYHCNKTRVIEIEKYSSLSELEGGQ